MSKPSKSVGSICGKCKTKDCYPLIKSTDPLPDIEEAPAYCPMRCYPEIMRKVKNEYAKPDIREFARLASVQEFECYEVLPEGRRGKFTRIEETIQFAQKCNYKKIGIAFCMGLREEIRTIIDIFESKGFELVSVNCKVGRFPKELIGITEQEKIAGPGIMETMCNPIAQAEVLNEEQVDLAIMVGLCVGHDTLFLKYIRPPCTVLAVKDRVLGHNPLAAVYLSKAPYYNRLMARSNKVEGTRKVRLPVDVNK